jgi:hypothetical protein
LLRSIEQADRKVLPLWLSWVTIGNDKRSVVRPWDDLSFISKFLGADRNAKADTIGQRQQAFDDLVAATERGIQSQISSNETLPPTIKDVLAGAINRRNLAEREYQNAVSSLERWQATIVGRIGRRILADQVP